MQTKFQVYKTIRNHCEYELKEKKSIFLAKAYPISEITNVDHILIDLKKKYYDASHRCYAYRLLGGRSKYSDAGEPSGSAGIRILNAIDHFELQNCMVAVIRYFGGTKLGVGPLGKAYYTSALNALKSAEIIEKRPYHQIELNLDFSHLNKILDVLHSNGAKIMSTSYETEVKINTLIPLENFNNLINLIREILKSDLNFAVKNEIIYY